MLTLSFSVPILFFMCFFCCILRQWNQFSSFFTMLSSAHILRISFFCEKIKHDTCKIKKLTLYFLKRQIHLEKLTFKVPSQIPLGGPLGFFVATLRGPLIFSNSCKIFKYIFHFQGIYKDTFYKTATFTKNIENVNLILMKILLFSILLMEQQVFIKFMDEV